MDWLPKTGLIFLLAGLPLLFIIVGISMARGAAWMRMRPRSFAATQLLLGAIWLIQSLLLFREGSSSLRAWGNGLLGCAWIAFGLAVWLRPEFWTGRGADQGADS